MKRTLALLTLCSFETMLVVAFATCAALAQETAPSYAIASPPACHPPQPQWPLDAVFSRKKMRGYNITRGCYYDCSIFTTGEISAWAVTP